MNHIFVCKNPLKLKLTSLSIAHSWLAYERFVGNSLQNHKLKADVGLNSWQDKLFTTLIVHIIPLSIIAVIFSITMELRMGHRIIAGFDAFTILAVVFFMLNRKIPLFAKRLILIIAAILFSLTSAIIFGYFTIAAVYLFGVSIFMAYQYSSIHAYLSVVGHFFIWLLIGIGMYNHLEWITAKFSLELFIVFTSNLLFLNLITVIIIRQTLGNFDRSIQKESILLKRLKDELIVVDQLNVQLAESEAQYKTLFFMSPLPKWIYDLETMMILQANEAALNSYGYTKAELLEMSISDLTDHTAEPHQKIIKKNGEISYVDLKWSSFLYKGKPSRIVIASDITERVNHLEEIERQNKRLQEIAYRQAHVIRSPLTKIMALSELIQQEYIQLQQEPLFTNLSKSAQELDQVIHDIIKHSENTSRT